ncbi:MAG TPA: prepilin-type N-terminal cleavage/methylation domain-containing protein [Candidatus Paceibacterota bacterium]
MQNTKRKTKSGFTLLETLVAIAILMISIASAFSLAPEGISGARFAKNQTVATYLAQEALEVAHNLRDNSMLFSPNQADPLSWLGGLSQCIDKLCTVNPITLELNLCSGSCPPVKIITGVDGSYTYGNGTIFDFDPNPRNSIFTRTVTVKNKMNSTIGRDDTEAKITVKVTWKEGIITKSTEISTELFDWWTYSK